MLVSAIFSLLLAALVSAEGQGTFTVLESRILSDGSTTLHRIQEHLAADDLPALSVPEEDFSLNKEEQEEIVVPVDANGNVLPEFQHLLKPQVVEMSREQIAKLNNSRINVERVETPVEANSLVAEASSNQEPNGNDVETAGTDYDEAAVPDSHLPAVKEYEDSNEKDPEVETGDDGMREEELEKIEKEIEGRNGKEGEVAREVLEDISAITKEATEELKEEVEEELQVEQAVKEILSVVAGGILDQKEEQKTEEEEITLKEKEEERNDSTIYSPKEINNETTQKKSEGESIEREKTAEMPSKMEEIGEKTEERIAEKAENTEKKANEEIDGAAEGAKVLDNSDFGEEPKEETAQPQLRPHRGEIIFRRARPDTSAFLQPTLAILFAGVLFLC